MNLVNLYYISFCLLILSDIVAQFEAKIWYLVSTVRCQQQASTKYISNLVFQKKIMELMALLQSSHYFILGQLLLKTSKKH